MFAFPPSLGSGAADQDRLGPTWDSAVEAGEQGAPARSATSPSAEGTRTTPQSSSKVGTFHSEPAMPAGENVTYRLWVPTKPTFGVCHEEIGPSSELRCQLSASSNGPLP